MLGFIYLIFYVSKCRHMLQTSCELLSNYDQTMAQQVSPILATGLFFRIAPK